MSKEATCHLCGPVDFPAATVTQATLREWTLAHIETDSHRGMQRLADELDASIFVPSVQWRDK